MLQTVNVYMLPFAPDTIVAKTVTDSPGHPGPYKGAVDFAVEPGTEVLAPLDGKVIMVVDTHDKYGTTPESAPYANYIQLKHAHGETSDLMHLERGSVLVKVGDHVKTGQQLAKTGLSGYMTAPHLHWFVFHKLDSKDGFEGLAIRLKSKGKFPSFLGLFSKKR
jgi:murein DD-endopeptidase MepM/ murein hydrolase activator NlpD